ncbi:PASTA domain-containing protein [Streptosporangiaceae bacterium NEAU-GS5]|nr:PASTA domain-containing protein [Streptosporangiaceae bacterium NEAU-GS5]
MLGVPVMIRSEMRQRFRSAVVAASILVVSAAVAGLPAGPATADPSTALLAWGENLYGEVGNGTETTSPPYGVLTPVPVASPAGQNVIQTSQAAGVIIVTYALHADGTLWKWGPTPSQVTVPGPVRQVSVSSFGDHGLIVGQDGTLWGWGRNLHGQLGIGQTDTIIRPDTALVRIPLTGVVEAAAGDSFSVALTSDGKVWTWGDGRRGEIGDGTVSSTPRTSPGQVVMAGQFVHVTARHSTAFAVRSDGALFGWGDNRVGQLGIGTTSDAEPSPQASGPAHVHFTQVAVGGSHVLAIATDSTVWSWGDNGAGAVGDGTTFSPRATPVHLGLSGITHVSAGLSGSVAVGGGKLWYWGDNAFGAAGNGTAGRTPITTPTIPPGMDRGVVWADAKETTVYAAMQVRTVPGVIGATEVQASDAITAAGLTPRVTRSPVCTNPGKVVNQSPEAGAQQASGTSVAFTVDTCVAVPGVMGATEAQANSAITAAGLIPSASHGKVCVDPGNVYGQSPSAGTPRPPGSTVNFNVDTAPRTCAIR